ncbi:MAG: DNA gyrase subunit B [Paenibacillaceae bacterium]|nr:DNA gyrase subunit B [Paenibacillaceae bacterium]
MKPSASYGAEDIHILEGLHAVRKRPGMYIGNTSTGGLHHLVWEIVDNAVDEHLASYAHTIAVAVHADGSVTVEDDGRGIPVSMHASGVPTPQVVFTVLHAGGKFGVGGGYAKSGGLHGVGASVTNALSEWLVVDIARDGALYRQKFASWVDADGTEHVGAPVTTLERIGDTKRTGTKVTFKPDARVFHGQVHVQAALLMERLQQIAFLNAGLRIQFRDERTDERVEYAYEGGLVSYVGFLNEGKSVLHDCVRMFGTKDGIDVEIAFQYHDGFVETIASYVNSIPTHSGGTHETGFKAAYTRVMNEYARKHQLLKEKDKNIEGADVREGMMAVLHVKMAEVEFVGQTKGQLGSSAARTVVESIVAEQLTRVLQEQPTLAHQLLKKALLAAKAREAARKAREDVRTGKKGRSDLAQLVGKLTPAQSKDRTRNELFIVEGDSAGGSAKQGRDARHQAILPLRGKPMNPEKAKLSDLLRNEEYRAIIATLGVDVGASCDPEGAHYGKVIIMTDADTDGAHIQVLLLTFFYRYMKPLIEQGMVYLARPPLYKVTMTKQKRFVYAYDEDALAALTREHGGNVEVQRYKGLGEMNPDQLWDTTMNPSARVLHQVRIEDATKAERRIVTLMGDAVEPRKRWIVDNVDFTQYDV